MHQEVFIDVMLNNETIYNILSATVAKATEYVRNNLGLQGVEINHDYDFAESFEGGGCHVCACYERGSVFEQTISIAFNENVYINSAKEYNLTDSEVIEDLQITVWHEVGHGIFELLMDYDDEGLFDDAHENDIRAIIGCLSSDEEIIVEDFGRDMTEIGFVSLLSDAVEEYKAFCNNQTQDAEVVESISNSGFASLIKESLYRTLINEISAYDAYYKFYDGKISREDFDDVIRFTGSPNSMNPIAKKIFDFVLATGGDTTNTIDDIISYNPLYTRMEFFYNNATGDIYGKVMKEIKSINIQEYLGDTESFAMALSSTLQLAEELVNEKNHKDTKELSIEIYRSDNFLVVAPLTMPAAHHNDPNAHWCTSSTEEHFQEYCTMTTWIIQVLYDNSENNFQFEMDVDGVIHDVHDRYNNAIEGNGTQWVLDKIGQDALNKARRMIPTIIDKGYDANSWDWEENDY